MVWHRRMTCSLVGICPTTMISLFDRVWAAEIISGSLFTVERVIDDRNSAFFHQPRHERYGIRVKDRRRHTDRYALGPIQRSHSDGTDPESVIFTFILRVEPGAVVHQELNGLVRALEACAVERCDPMIVYRIWIGAKIQQQLDHFESLALGVFAQHSIRPAHARRRHKWGCMVEGGNRRIGFVSQQQTHHGKVAAQRRTQQGRGACFL